MDKFNGIMDKYNEAASKMHVMINECNNIIEVSNARIETIVEPKTNEDNEQIAIEKDRVARATVKRELIKARFRQIKQMVFSYIIAVMAKDYEGKFLGPKTMTKIFNEFEAVTNHSIVFCINHNTKKSEYFDVREKNHADNYEKITLASVDWKSFLIDNNKLQYDVIAKMYNHYNEELEKNPVDYSDVAVDNLCNLYIAAVEAKTAAKEANDAAKEAIKEYAEAVNCNYHFYRYGALNFDTPVFHMIDGYDLSPCKNSASIVTVEPVEEAPAAVEPEKVEPETIEEIDLAEIFTGGDEKVKAYAVTKNSQYGSTEIAFSEKPCKEVRDFLKSVGFRWHSVNKIWYGYQMTVATVVEYLEELYAELAAKV